MAAWPLPDATPPARVWTGISRSIRRPRLHPATAAAAVLALLLLATSGAMLVRHPSALVQRLVGTDLAPTASARLLRTGTGALFIAWNLPPAPRGEVYELWAIRGKDHVRAAVFRPDASGRAVVSLSASLFAASYGVTLEPSPGSSHPSGRRVLHE